MKQQEIINIIAKALLDNDKIDYIVRIFNGKGLQIQTYEKIHYNIIMRDIDRLKGNIVQIRHETKKAPKGGID